MKTGLHFKSMLTTGLAALALAACIAPSAGQLAGSAVSAPVPAPVMIDTFTAPAAVLNSWYTPSGGWSEATPRLLGDVVQEVTLPLAVEGNATSVGGCQRRPQGRYCWFCHRRRLPFPGYRQ